MHEVSPFPFPKAMQIQKKESWNGDPELKRGGRGASSGRRTKQNILKVQRNSQRRRSTKWREREKKERGGKDQKGGGKRDRQSLKWR